MGLSNFIFSIFYEAVYIFTIAYNKLVNLFCYFNHENNNLCLNIKTIILYPTLEESNFFIKNIHSFNYLHLVNYDLYIISNNNKSIITNDYNKLKTYVSNYFKNKAIFKPSKESSILSFCVNYNENIYEFNLDQFMFSGNNIANRVFIFWYLKMYHNINLSQQENTNYTISYIDSNADIHENISTNTLIL